mmetsp:Transcript_84820/g.213853  ORF Transcript_84820/g.213853 Transcript_84820/m.213853 type:complete len:153 (-) Transcript_84820:58-516(-)
MASLPRGVVMACSSQDCCSLGDSGQEEISAEGPDGAFRMPSGRPPRHADCQLLRRRAGYRFKARLSKPVDTPLGMVLELIGDDTLEVVSIRDGPIQRYNELSGQTEQLKESDLITEVNGIRGNNEMMIKVLRNDSALEIGVERHGEASWGCH